MKPKAALSLVNMKTKYSPTAVIILCGLVFLSGFLVLSVAEAASPFSVEKTQRGIGIRVDPSKQFKKGQEEQNQKETPPGVAVPASPFLAGKTQGVARIGVDSPKLLSKDEEEQRRKSAPAAKRSVFIDRSYGFKIEPPEFPEVRDGEEVRPFKYDMPVGKTIGVSVISVSLLRKQTSLSADASGEVRELVAQNFRVVDRREVNALGGEALYLEAVDLLKNVPGKRLVCLVFYGKRTVYRIFLTLVGCSKENTPRIFEEVKSIMNGFRLIDAEVEDVELPQDRSVFVDRVYGFAITFPPCPRPARVGATGPEICFRGGGPSGLGAPASGVFTIVPTTGNDTVSSIRETLQQDLAEFSGRPVGLEKIEKGAHVVGYYGLSRAADGRSHKLSALLQDRQAIYSVICLLSAQRAGRESELVLDAVKSFCVEGF